MTYSITVEFLRGVYVSGSSERREDSEWPPSPARLFCALVAAADPAYAASDAALLWLEAQPAPAIIASPENAVERSLARESYPPLNDGAVGGSTYGRFAARKAGAIQRWRHVSAQSPLVRYEWPTVPPPDVAAELGAFAAAVPYLGRSTCPVEISAGPTNDLDPGDGSATAAVRWEPGGLTDRVVLGVPRMGYLQGLRDAFDGGRRAHEVPRHQLAYGVHRSASAVAYGAHDDDLIVLPFHGRRLGPAQVMLVTRALLKALESHLDGGPSVLRGARRDEVAPRQQVLLLGLPQIGHAHATGFIAGLALAMPRDIDPSDRRSILRATVAVEEQGLVAGSCGRFEFSGEPSALRSLEPGRWAGPATSWVSATPMSADRFIRLDRPAEVRAEIDRACQHAGLPTPISVEVSLRPLAPGAASVAPHQRRRRPDDRPTPSFHARLTFEEAVRGPVVLGNLRRYGLGLFAPEGV